jgi:hypothetical protein
MIKRLILVSCMLLITQFTDARAIFHPIDDRAALTTLIVSKKATSTQNNEAAGCPGYCLCGCVRRGILFVYCKRCPRDGIQRN